MSNPFLNYDDLQNQEEGEDEQGEEQIQELERTQDSYYWIQKLGEGAQGQVWKAIVKSTKQIIALKVVYVNKNQDILNTALQEVEYLKEASNPNCHPFLICYYGSYYDAILGALLIEMEFIEGVNLKKWSKEYRDKKQYDRLDTHLLAMLKDLSKALDYMSSKNIIHRDIKPDNILVTPQNIPKIVDLGLACNSQVCPTNSPEIAYTCCYGRTGTPIFFAPETVINGVTYFASDIWCLGASIFNAATGEYCFNFTKDKKVYDVIKNEQPKKLNTQNINLNTVVNQMLVKNPLQRINIELLVQELD